MEIIHQTFNKVFKVKQTFVSVKYISDEILSSGEMKHPAAINEVIQRLQYGANIS